jgi:hypothetical protein
MSAARPARLGQRRFTAGFFASMSGWIFPKSRRPSAGPFGHNEEILVSWFRPPGDLRNKCAHHNRAWNFAFVVNKLKIAERLPTVFGPGLNPRTDLFCARAVVLAALLGWFGRGGLDDAKRIDRFADG